MLNEQQIAALDTLHNWLLDKENDPFFLIAGSAGTGKTFLMQEFIRQFKGGRVLFTAPTNKAVKVLKQTLTKPDYRPECKTIYSALGLVLSAKGEVKEIEAPEDPVDLSKYAIVVVDEGSMVNEALMGHIRDAAENFGVRFIFMGDAAQLPPVGEEVSQVWDIYDQAHLTKVMRQDNQILTLATTLRGAVAAPSKSIQIVNDHDEGGGVYRYSQRDFEAEIVSVARTTKMFQEANKAKIIAWRNVTVDRYNALVRAAIFGPEAISPWLREDRVIFTSPAKDLEDQLFASTDDEGTVVAAEEGWHPVWTEFRTWNVRISLDDGGVVLARVLHPGALLAYNARKEELAAEARKNGRRWKTFWEFQESFHTIRHAYAITAHRSQGSTYQAAYVDWVDILRNLNRKEARQCLYVAATRPKLAVIFN